MSTSTMSNTGMVLYQSTVTSNLKTRDTYEIHLLSRSKSRLKLLLIEDPGRISWTSMDL